jgi:hypothetical protein
MIEAASQFRAQAAVSADGAPLTRRDGTRRCNAACVRVRCGERGKPMYIKLYSLTSKRLCEAPGNTM